MLEKRLEDSAGMRNAVSIVTMMFLMLIGGSQLNAQLSSTSNSTTTSDSTSTQSGSTLSGSTDSDIVSGGGSDSLVNQLPLAPTGLVVDSGDAQKSQTALHVSPIDRTPVFSAVFEHGNSGVLSNQAQIEVATDSAFTQIRWTSGWVDILDGAEGQTSDNIGYDGPGLKENTLYYWRIRFEDAQGNQSAWSSEAVSFKTSTVLREPTVVSQDVVNSQTWLNAGSPYVVDPPTGTVVIRNAATLVLDDRDGDVWLEWKRFTLMKVGDGDVEAGVLKAYRKYDGVDQHWTVRIPDTHGSLLYVTQTGSLVTRDSRTEQELSGYNGKPFTHESFFKVETVWQGGTAPTWSPGLMDYSANSGQSLALLDGSNHGTTGPWGRLGDDKDGNSREHGWDKHPVLNSESLVTEGISGRANLGSDGESQSVYYGEIYSDWTDEEERWKDLIKRIRVDNLQTTYGIMNCGYAIVGPGWTTSVEAHARIYRYPSGNFYPQKQELSYKAITQKTLVGTIRPELGHWTIEYDTRLYAQAACTEAGGEAAAIAHAHQWFIYDEHIRHSRVAVCEYSNEWFEDMMDGDYPHPWIEVLEENGNRSIRIPLGDGKNVPTTSREESGNTWNSVPDDWNGTAPDIFTRNFTELKGGITTETEPEWSSNTVLVAYGDDGWVYAHNDAFGEWSMADVQHRALYGAYSPRRLLRIDLRRMDPESGKWETVKSMTKATLDESESEQSIETEWEADTRDIEQKVYKRKQDGADPVAKTEWIDSETGEVIGVSYGPGYYGDHDEDTYLDDTDKLEGVKVVRVYEAARNPEYKDPKFWTVQLTSWDDTPIDGPDDIATYKFD